MIKTNIDNLLKTKGKTRYWLAKEIGVTYPTIKYLCEDKSDSIKFKNIYNICKALNCNIEDILELSD